MNADLNGPFRLTPALVDERVNFASSGAFVLGHDTGYRFRIETVGWAEDVQRLLREQAELGRYRHFAFQYVVSRQDAYRQACALFHQLAPQQEGAHPVPPETTDWKCPHCAIAPGPPAALDAALKSEGAQGDQAIRHTPPAPGPATLTAASGPAPSLSMHKDQQPLRALVVDDNRDAAEILSALLRALGVTSQSAFDGTTAVLLASQTKPDLVLLDIMMPKMDGFEVRDALRDVPGLEHTAFIAVTGSTQDSVWNNLDSAGFASALLKPVTLDTLTKVLLNVGISLEAPGPDHTPAKARRAV